MPARKPRSQRNALLGKIHIGLKQLPDLDNDAYRDMLEDRYGHRSAAKLTVSQLKDCVEHLEGLGAAFTKKPQPDDAQVRKIRSLWIQLYEAGKVRNPSEQALAAYVKRQIGIDKLEWIAPRQASDVIEQLKKWLDRD